MQRQLLQAAGRQRVVGPRRGLRTQVRTRARECRCLLIDWSAVADPVTKQNLSEPLGGEKARVNTFAR